MENPVKIFDQHRSIDIMDNDNPPYSDYHVVKKV